MDFQTAIKTCFQKYATFEGRAGRQEFWWFLLFQLLVMAACQIVLGEKLTALVNLALLLPGLAVSVRRLHDVGKSGWFILLWLVPLIGWGILIYWGCLPSTASNEWGAPSESLAQAPSEPAPPGSV